MTLSAGATQGRLRDQWWFTHGEGPVEIVIDDAVVVRAASLYGDLHRRGELIGDADILIAATCLEHQCELVTNNASHFARIEGLVLQNWVRA